MSITAKQAYQAVKKETVGFRILGCRELSDRFVFGWCNLDGTAISLPPICVFKDDGNVSFHDEMPIAFLDKTCREQGKKLSIEELETAQQ